jgi:cytoskeletal protein RodZ
MVDSVGKKLSQTRLKRGLTLEEVAHVTKLRPDKIVALETDDYSSFPSNAYAKGFLQIYARYLRVDVTEFLASLDSSNSISVEDYQYLSNAPTPKAAEPVRKDRRPPSIAPLVFFILVVLIGLSGWWLITNYQRTLPHSLESASDVEESSKPLKTNPAPGVSAETAEKPAKPAVASSAKPPGSPVTPAPAPARATAPVAASSRPSVPPAPSPAPGTTAASNAPATSPLPAPTPRFASSTLTDRDFITPTVVPTPDRAAITSPRSGLNEVLVASIKKTWVTIRRDDPKAAPIFEDFIYPNTNPLKLKGARFFIDARDPSSVQITKNGLPIASPDPNVPVQ